MKILIVRHADPDYSVDSLTKKGWREAEYLAERLSKLKVKDFFVSPLGRAKDTASLTLKKMQRTAKEYPWLREFAPTIIRPDVGAESIVWDGSRRTGRKKTVFMTEMHGVEQKCCKLEKWNRNTTGLFRDWMNC